jgi:hypothetical protein
MLKRILTFGIAVASTGSFQANAITLDFASVAAKRGTGNSGGLVQVQGSAFGFQNAMTAGTDTGYSFSIVNSDSGTGAALGLKGAMIGSWNIGAVSSLGYGIEQASVSGVGQLYIFDGLTAFTADLSWAAIRSSGTSENLNVSGDVNLSNFAYSGANSDLVALLGAAQGVETVTFQFTSPISLSQLTDGTKYSRSFSGTIEGVPSTSGGSSVPDGGLTACLLGVGMLAMAGCRRLVRC